MKFLDANGLALFTKKIFNKFVSNVSGADNKITITKGDGTTNEINLDEVLKTDEIAENPPADDNTNKIASTSWVQNFVAIMVFKLISKLAGTEETGVSSSGSFLGVNWLIAQNGYICLGKLFGYAIIQWGMSEYTSLQANVDNTIKYPITITEVYCLIPFLKHGWKERAFAGTPFYINDLFNSYFKMAVTKEITAKSWFYWLIIISQP